MRTFSAVLNIVYLCLGAVFVLLGLITLLAGALEPDGSAVVWGVILLLIGGLRIAWSIYRMRAYARFNAAQNAQLRQGYKSPSDGQYGRQYIGYRPNGPGMYPSPPPDQMY